MNFYACSIKTDLPVARYRGEITEVRKMGDGSLAFIEKLPNGTRKSRMIPEGAVFIGTLQEAAKFYQSESDTVAVTTLHHFNIPHQVEPILRRRARKNKYLQYYDADWEQNAFPDAPGDTPLEKYLNGINGVGMNNPPKWNNILPALAGSSLFLKILTTQNPNAFSALQTVVQYRNMEFSKL